MPSITDSIGRVLGDRYRLVTALGTGASAHVYLADDVTLQRRVAIKVLHPALAGDQSFLKRFRAEAQAVAGLNHPNVLQVYDWGEDDGQPFLVLEYLAGGSLREVYDTGALLTPEQAVAVGLEAAAGLDYAHRRGLVHRDVKPANLLFDADRRLRIADFGLARALAEAAWTEPDGAILGTARYAAPEQVEGWALDGRADVYALALVLYEGVTGEAPFVGDTVASTLMARVDALLPDHERLGPLYDVLVWAAAPHHDERYDAAQLALRLQALSVALPAPAPLPLADHDHPAGSEGVPVPAARRRRPPAGPVDDRTELGTPELAAAATARPVRAETVADEPPPPARRRRRWPMVTAAAVLVAALLGGGLAYAVHARLFTPSHPLPSLVGRTLPEARAAVAGDHVTLAVVARAHSVTGPAGTVLRQDPAGGPSVTVKEGTTVDVVLSLGPPPVTVPDLTTFSTCGDAVQALAAVHLVGSCPASAARYSATVAAGRIIGTVPTGSAPYGSAVVIVTSRGHAPVAVPAVAGAASFATAAAALHADGFAAVEAQAYSATVPAGQVVGSSPSSADGPVAYGSTVRVTVSLGPQPVKVPDVLGQSPAAAVAALRADGLEVSGPYGPPGATTVLSIDPAPGTEVKVGSTVIVDTA